MNIPALAMVFFVFTLVLGISRLVLAVIGALIIGPIVVMSVRKERVPDARISAPLDVEEAEEEESRWGAVLSSGVRQWARSSIGYFVRMAPIMIIAGFASGLAIQWLSADTVSEYLGNDARGVVIAATFGILINVPLLFEIPLVALLLLLGMGTAPAATLLFTAAAGGPVTFWGLARLMPRRAIATFAGTTWALGAIGGLVILAGSAYFWEGGGLGHRVAYAHACNQIDALQRGVLYETLTVDEIKRDLDAIAAEVKTTDEPMRSSGKTFVRWAREIAYGGYYDYPTFDVLNYLETYEQMELHVQVDAALNQVERLCDWEPLTVPPAGAVQSAQAEGVDPPGGAVGGAVISQASSPLAPPELPPDAVITSSEEAQTAVRAFLGEQPWGFFGATCAMWLRLDYEWNPGATFYSNDEDRWVVSYTLIEDRLVGPERLIFRVHPITSETQGDNRIEEGRFGVSEGCDRW